MCNSEIVSECQILLRVISIIFSGKMSFLWVAQGYMLRVVSSLLPSERWLQLPASHSNHWTMGLPGLKSIFLSVPGRHIGMVCDSSHSPAIETESLKTKCKEMSFMFITFSCSSCNITCSCSAPANRCPSCASIVQLRLVQISGISSNKFVSFWGLFFFFQDRKSSKWFQVICDTIVMQHT